MRENPVVTKVWSTLEVKAVDEATGIIRGIASTPSTDLAGDIVEPEGAKYTLPIPLLEQHDHDRPVGHVHSVNVTKAGIEIEAKLAIDSGLIYVDKVWKQIKSGLVRGLSIGFKSIDAEPIKGKSGWRYKQWQWLELSAVTIPANMDASISLVKSLDTNSTGDTAESGTELSPKTASLKIEAAKSRAAQAVIKAKRALRQSTHRK